MDNYPTATYKGYDLYPLVFKHDVARVWPAGPTGPSMLRWSSAGKADCPKASRHARSVSMQRPGIMSGRHAVVCFAMRKILLTAQFRASQSCHSERHRSHRHSQ